MCVWEYAHIHSLRECEVKISRLNIDTNGSESYSSAKSFPLYRRVLKHEKRSRSKNRKDAPEQLLCHLGWDARRQRRVEVWSGGATATQRINVVSGYCFLLACLSRKCAARRSLWNLSLNIVRRSSLRQSLKLWRCVCDDVS